MSQTTSILRASLEVHPITDPADLANFARIQMAAFSGGGGMTALLTPDPLPADYEQKAINKHLKSWRDEPDVTYLKVIDPALGGKMIAGAKWRINKKERTEEQIQPMLPVPGPDEEGRPASQDFMWYLNRVRKQYMGTKPFYCKGHGSSIAISKSNYFSPPNSCHTPRSSQARRRRLAARLGLHTGQQRRITDIYRVNANGPASLRTLRVSRGVRGGFRLD
jgi:hypothetical protein